MQLYTLARNQKCIITGIYYLLSDAVHCYLVTIQLTNASDDSWNVGGSRDE